MAKSFKHETLGTLTFDDDRWTGKVTLDAAFGKHKWSRKLDVELPGDEAGPDPKGIELLRPLVEHAATLPDLVVDGLWAELDGREKENGHWWARKGGLEEVNDGLDEPIEDRDGLWRVLRPHTLFVRDDFHGDGELTPGVAFHCDFEEEHGLDVLTDGTRILGTGYATDAEKYKRFQKPRTKRSNSKRT
jgi:hypothetical protein